MNDTTIRDGAPASAIEQWIIEPHPTSQGQAAAVICGHAFIHGRGEEEMCEFYGFVQEVLDTTVVPEIERATRRAGALEQRVRDLEGDVASYAATMKRLEEAEANNPTVSRAEYARAVDALRKSD